eukprot:TRINITY_DN49882_c0_g1_i1.p1 TRINITY_DN49882_c0_g1~~TRINITY_DN49882_c0_g1_i1.p1  ORF type:complete len:530 (+),score=76.29 TRINITY_DN49882_c0_g1_i1:74-1663(+)
MFQCWQGLCGTAPSVNDELAFEAVGDPGDPLRGLSVDYLSTSFLEEVVNAGFSKDSVIYEIEEVVIRGKAPKMKCPRDGGTGAAYVDAINGSENASRATHMLSYTWQYAVGDIGEALAAWCRANRHELGQIFVWMCCTCINQHRVQEARARGETVPFETFAGQFKRRIAGIGRVLALMQPWQAPLYLTRAWCIFELANASFVDHCQIDIIMPPREMESMFQCLSQPPLASQNPLDVLWETLSKVTISNAQAFEPSDLAHIMEMVNAAQGVAALDAVVRESLREWFRNVSEKLVLARLQESSPILAVDVCVNVARMCRQQGYLKHSERILESGMNALTKSGVHETPGAALIMREQGATIDAHGDFDGAICVYKKAYHIRSTTGTLDCHDGAMLLVALGASHEHSGDIEAALEYYQQAKEIRARTGSLESPDGAHLLKFIAHVFAQRGQLKEADGLLKQACLIRDATQSWESPPGADLYMEMANVSLAQGDSDAALVNLKEAQRILETLGAMQSTRGRRCLAALESLEPQH